VIQSLLRCENRTDCKEREMETELPEVKRSRKNL